ncbi:ABC transporter, substrate-binding protein [Moorella glycerini]|uniref:ABC transporter substrate binding protein n=1 Tax=Neomoorella stamsii TaxID=1266720 RepID=A0A9X7P5F0_9FIRM|nr:MULTISPECIES: ABC transporter substrate-binding protein [Moorella]PRR71443.1 ABC transporter substrate binding protein [Moorella stamsii]CEP68652.1 ABC transporter, substrate-binding protein [Moorella glycerini]
MKKYVWIWIIVALVVTTIFFFFHAVRKTDQQPLVAVLLMNDARQEKLTGLRDGLAQMGYTEGKNITFITANARSQRDDLERLATELVAQKPDVLVAGGRLEAEVLAPQAQKVNIPLIFMGAAATWNVQKSDLGARGTITGIDNYHVDLAGKRLELLVKLVPGIQRVLVLYDPRVVPGPASLAVVQEAARKLNILLHVMAVTSLKELKANLEMIPPEAADAVLVMSGFLLEEGMGSIGKAAIAKGWPVMGLNAADAEAGALAAYGCPFVEQGRQAARLVAKVLAGKDVAAIPIETPDRLELVVNLGVARQLGIEISPTVLGLASQILDRGVNSNAVLMVE